MFCISFAHFVVISSIYTVLVAIIVILLSFVMPIIFVSDCFGHF